MVFANGGISFDADDNGAVVVENSQEINTVDAVFFEEGKVVFG